MKLKVCGIRDNPAAVASLAPDYLGLIFWEPSARYVDTLYENLPGNIPRVGVFVDASLDQILERTRAFDLSLIQLHGSESPEFCAALREDLYAKLPEIADKPAVIKVFSVNEAFDFKMLQPYEEVCDYYLFDTKGKLPGGNGFAFNWELLRDYPSVKPFFLSGGIGLDQVPQLIRFLDSPAARYCHALDVNSKFEIQPGLKDVPGLKRFKQMMFQNRKDEL